MSPARLAVEWRFPHTWLMWLLLASLRFVQHLKPDLFSWLMGCVVFPLSKRLEGWLLRGIIARTPATGLPSGLDAEWLTLPGHRHDTRTALLYLPGGAFVITAPVSTAFAARLLPRLAGLLPETPPVLVLKYQLPACHSGTQKEVRAAISWLQGEGFERIVLAGDSAGGYLALQSSSSAGVVAAVGICPLLDFCLSLGSWQQNQTSCFLTPAWVKAGCQKFLRNQVRNGTDAEKLFQELSLTSTASAVAASGRPILLVAAASDTLRDDAFAFRDRAGIDANVEVFECQGGNCFHDSMLLPLFHEASHRAAFDRMAEKLSELLK